MLPMASGALEHRGGGQDSTSHHIPCSSLGFGDHMQLPTGPQNGVSAQGRPLGSRRTAEELAQERNRWPGRRAAQDLLVTQSLRAASARGGDSALTRALSPGQR